MDENDVVDFYSSEDEVEKKPSDEEEFYEDEEDEELMAKRAKEREEAELAKHKVSVQFKQISMGDVLCCGITLLEEDLMCWPCNRDRVYNPKIQPPTFIRGPFRQVAVGRNPHAVVCAIRRQPPISDLEPDAGHTSNREMIELDENGHVQPNVARFESGINIHKLKAEGKHPSLHCWPGSALPEAVQWWPVGWDQIHIPVQGPMCMVSMESELFCWEEWGGFRAVPDVIVA
jgi:hypothetical protein